MSPEQRAAEPCCQSRWLHEDHVLDAPSVDDATYDAYDESVLRSSKGDRHAGPT